MLPGRKKVSIRAPWKGTFSRLRASSASQETRLSLSLIQRVYPCPLWESDWLESGIPPHPKKTPLPGTIPIPCPTHWQLCPLTARRTVQELGYRGQDRGLSWTVVLLYTYRFLWEITLYSVWHPRYPLLSLGKYSSTWNSSSFTFKRT